MSKPPNTDVDGWCTVHTIAMCIRAAVSFRKCMIDAADAASSPDVGSSRNTTCGFLHSAVASESRRFWPPDRPLNSSFPARVCSHPSSPVSTSSLSLNARTAAADARGWNSAAANSRCSRVVRNGHSWLVCIT